MLAHLNASALEVPRHLRHSLETVTPNALHEAYTFTLDVPITESDLTRWGKLLNETAPHVAVTGGGFIDPSAALAMREAAELHSAVHKLTPMKLLDAPHVARAPMTKTLLHRRKWLPHRQRIPVYQCRGPLLDALLKTQVLALVAPPASGRTLQVPQIIAETEVFKSKRLILVCPTTAVAERTAQRLRAERGEESTSRSVGLCTPMEYGVTPGTLIAVTTPEMLVRQLLCDPLLLHVGCVIMDDMHLRSPVTELCLALLRATLRQLHEESYIERRGGPLRVIINCLEDAVAVTMSDYFGEDCTTRINLSQMQQEELKGMDEAGLHGWSVPAVLYLEETVQWLAKCEKEGNTICRDPVEDLKQYVEDIGVVGRVMAAEEAIFTNDERLKSYWCSILTHVVRAFDGAERNVSSHNTNAPSTASLSLPWTTVVVVVPDVHVASIVVNELNIIPEPLDLKLHCLLNDAKEEDIRLAMDDAAAATIESSRVVLVMTPLLAQCAIPSSVSVGLVVDCARRSYDAYDISLDANTHVTEYSLLHELRYRRSIGRVRIQTAGEASTAHGCMVVQLIPKSILYSTKHRRMSGDATQHPVFHASWESYIELYHLLQARAEGLRCREIQNQIQTEAQDDGESHALSKIVPQLFTSVFLGAPPASSNRYELLRRVFVAVEGYLQRLGHLEHPSRLTPFGVAATCLALPIPPLRMMIFARLCDCVVPASVIAATWLTGDLFFATHSNADTESRQLMKEARSFFARESGSDVIAAFNAYYMWLSLRSSSDETEAEFLADSNISRKQLQLVESCQVKLLHVLAAVGLCVPINDVSYLEATVLKLPEDALLQGHTLLRCVTAALYPQCVIPQTDGTAMAFGMTDPMESNPRVNLRLAVFAEQSVMSTPESYTAYAKHPFLYLQHANVFTPHIPSYSNGIRVLAEAAPLCKDATVAFCGERTEYVKTPPTRCRGWMSVLTNAWRQTKRAQQLPPPAQLPEVAIPIKPYDTIRAPRVVVKTDDTFAFNMRATTARWLQLIREHTHRRIQALIYDSSWPSTHAVASPQDSHTTTTTNNNNNSNIITNNDNTMSDLPMGLAEAWEWWRRRSVNAHEWLREERAVVKDGSRETFLFPFYTFSTNPGKPEVIVPTERRHRTAQGVVETSPSSSAATAAAAAGGGTMSQQQHYQQQPQQQYYQEQSSVYIGKMPDPLVVQNVKDTARSVAKAGSREQENSFLQRYPELFAFLDPENEFHGYYLHVLRSEAPDLEVLGDNIEEVEKFLQQLEDELRTELGLHAEESSADGANAAANHQTYSGGSNTFPGNEAHAMYQFQEVNAEDEYMASYGMQVETAAERARKAPLLFKTSDARGSTTANSHKGVIGDSILGAAPNNGPSTTTTTTPSSSSFFTPTISAGNMGSGPINQTGSANTGAGLLDGGMQKLDDGSAHPNTSYDPNAPIGNFTFDRNSVANAATETSASNALASNVAGGAGMAGGGSEPTLMERLLAMKGSSSGNTEANASLPPPPPSSSSSHPPPTSSSHDHPSGVNPSDSAGLAPPQGSTPQQDPNIFSSLGIWPNVMLQSQQHISTTPTAAELLALISGVPLAPPVNPLTVPPPPLPAKVLADRPASVLVYPVPSREFGNIPLILAKALGETMNVKVGPTLIVGNVARIVVPNHKVEARALQLKSFTCVGKKVYIFKNDRIIDNPLHVGSGRGRHHKGRLNPPDGGPVKAPRDEAHPNRDWRGAEDGALHDPEEWNVPHDPVAPNVEEEEEVTPPTRKPAQIGHFTDSEDEDEDEEEESVSESESERGNAQENEENEDGEGEKEEEASAHTNVE